MFRRIISKLLAAFQTKTPDSCVCPHIKLCENADDFIRKYDDVIKSNGGVFPVYQFGVSEKDELKL